MAGSTGSQLDSSNSHAQEDVGRPSTMSESERNDKGRE